MHRHGLRRPADGEAEHDAPEDDISLPTWKSFFICSSAPEMIPVS
jgi:hypothetical protein